MSEILIVDDNNVTARLLSHSLRKVGYSCTIMNNAYNALDFLAENQPDLLLCDLDMPGMSGMELIAELRQGTFHANLPVVMLTASGVDADRQQALELGVQAFLNKPTSSRDLVQTVEDALQAAPAKAETGSEPPRG